MYRPIWAGFCRYTFGRIERPRRLTRRDYFVNNSLSGFSCSPARAVARRQTSAVRQLGVADKAAPDENLPVSESEHLARACGNTSIGRVNVPRLSIARARRESGSGMFPGDGSGMVVETSDLAGRPFQARTGTFRVPEIQFSKWSPNPRLHSGSVNPFGPRSSVERSERLSGSAARRSAAGRTAAVADVGHTFFAAAGTRRGPSFVYPAR